MQHRRLMAIDPSLTCSGWALFEVRRGRLTAVGKIRSLPPSLPLARRLVDLQDKIERLFEEMKIGAEDVLICEAPTTMRDPHAAIKVEQVRGIFETVARSRSVTNPGRLNPRSVHREVLGMKGRQLPRSEIKEMASQVVFRLFHEGLEALGFAADLKSLQRHQDIVDAILIGYLALTKLRTSAWAGQGLDEFFDRKSSRRAAS